MNPAQSVMNIATGNVTMIMSWARAQKWHGQEKERKLSENIDALPEKEKEELLPAHRNVMHQ